jgi:aconitase A
MCELVLNEAGSVAVGDTAGATLAGTTCRGCMGNVKAITAPVRSPRDQATASSRPLSSK